ncbi:MAG: outer membrane lipoprotein-sorting protein [Treponema sp.]
MKFTFLKVSAAFAVGIAALSIAAAEESALSIMEKNRDVEHGKTNISTAVMTLTNKKGAVRVRELASFKKDFGDTEKTVIVVKAPKDVAGVSYLQWEYKEKNGVKKDRDNWLYVPALKKVRRISGSESSGNFMGTDFTYDDMGERALSKDDFELLGEENADGEDCWKIECRAKDTSEKEPRRIVWVRKDNFLMHKAEFFDKQDKLHRVFSVSDVKTIDGIWTVGKMRMENVQTGHFTVIETKDVAYNQEINDSVFTVSALERGAVK